MNSNPLWLEECRPDNVLLAIARGIADELSRVAGGGSAKVEYSPGTGGFRVTLFRGARQAFGDQVATAVLNPDRVLLLLGQYITKNDDVFYTRRVRCEYEDPAWVDRALELMLLCL